MAGDGINPDLSYIEDKRQHDTEFLREMTDSERVNESEDILICELRVNPTATEIKCGLTAMEGRHTVRIENLSSDYVYWSAKDDITASEVEANLLHSGASITISLNPKKEVKLYSITRIRQAPLKVTEVR